MQVGDVRFAYTVLVGKRKWRKLLGNTSAYRSGNNIKMNLQYILCKCVDNSDASR